MKTYTCHRGIISDTNDIFYPKSMAILLKKRRAYKNELPSDISGTDSKLDIKLYTET